MRENMSEREAANSTVVAEPQQEKQDFITDVW